VVKRILNGEKLTQQDMPDALPLQCRVDWKQLQRWHLSEARLPAGTVIVNRPPGAWEQYKGYIIGGILLLLLESLLIVRLLVEARKRKESEAGLKDLSRRLINTQEEERRRIARELHDDLNQRMALLSGRLEWLARSSGEPSAPLNGEILSLSKETSEISATISRLSHRLHSSALEILGLAPALRGLCREFSHSHRLEVAFTCDGDVEEISPEIGLCLFRIAQESLMNVVKHSGAKTASVQLSLPRTGLIELTVADDGKGFDVAHPLKDSLGILSMRERLRLVGGELRIHSHPMRGTLVCGRVPHHASAAESSPSAA